MSLRRSVLSGPGISRVRRGKGFSCYDADGKPVSDPAALARIKELVIPPAWKKVWISPHHNGVLALALHLLDRGYFRAGGEQYAEDNECYGIATLLCDHVTLHEGAVAFDYPAKSGVRRTLRIEDPEVVRAVRSLLRRTDRTERLLMCRSASGWADVHADDLNARFKELVGDQYSVKDLRTWHGTVQRAGRIHRPAAAQAVLEKAARTLINRIAKGSPQLRRPDGTGLATAA